MPSSAVCSIADPIESIKERVESSLAKMDAANGHTQRLRRPLSAQVAPTDAHKPPGTSRPCTAAPSAPSRLRSQPRTTPAPNPVESASRDLLDYARQRFQSAIAAEERDAVQLGGQIEAMELRNGADTPSALSIASQRSHFTSKTRLSAYVTLASSVSGAGVPGEAHTDPVKRASREQRLRLLNEIRLRDASHPVKFSHDRVAQELCQEGGLPSRTAVFAYPWPDSFQWRLTPRPVVEEENRRQERRLKLRMEAAAKIREPEPPVVEAPQEQEVINVPKSKR